jgi:hypothetical protein
MANGIDRRTFLKAASVSAAGMVATSSLPSLAEEGTGLDSSYHSACNLSVWGRSVA